jgi:hypothetical protein
MKSSRISQKLLYLLPMLCIVTSIGIVLEQSARRDRLSRELAAYDSEHSRLEKRYDELLKASGMKPPADAPAHHNHHDGDGD